MNLSSNYQPDLDAIARNLIAIDLAYLSPEEATPYEYELSVIAALNEALENATLALKLTESPDFWQRFYPMLSDAAALLNTQLAPLLDLNAERHTEMSETSTKSQLTTYEQPIPSYAHLPIYHKP